MGKEKPGYWAVLPATVRYEERLPANAKLLYAELSALAQVDGYCWASNQHLGNLFGVDKKTVSRLISLLAERGYIRVDVERNEKGQVVRRKVYTGLFSVTPVDENPAPEEAAPSPQNCGVFNRKNNTSIEHTPISPTKKYPKDVCEAMSAYCGNDILLIRAMEAFLDNRIAIGKPIKTNRAAKLLTNKLDKLSGGDGALKVALLDEATLHNWLSVFPLKLDGQPSQQPSQPLRGKGVRYE